MASIRPMSMVHELIDFRAREAGDRIAIRFRGSSISWAEIALRSRVLSGLLATSGIGKETRLGILMGNRPDWLVTAIAASRVGAVFFPLSTFLRAGELEDVLRRAEVEAIVYSPFFSGTGYRELLGDLAASARLSRLSLLLEWEEGASAPKVVCGEIGERRSPQPANRDDVAMVFYTSGSTGEPKGVVHAAGPMLRHASVIAARMGVGRDDRSWSTFPFFFNAGIMIYAYAGFAAGATLVLDEKFEPESALRLLEEEGCTVYQGWPHQVEAMMALPRFHAADLAAVRKANGAKFLPHDAFLRHPHEAIDGWGMTETLTYCCSTLSTDPLDVRLGSHGKPLPGVEIRVVDPESGRSVATGVEGELSVRGYNLMRGYLGQPAGAHLDAEGAFRSGDLGRIDADGNVHFLGRLKEIIKTAGVNVAAAEVEKLLAGHPAVEAAHVVGVPDASRGELIAAFVVRSAPCTEQDLVEFAAARTARYKVPRWIVFVEREALPETGTGKIHKPRLREIALMRFAGVPGRRRRDDL